METRLTLQILFTIPKEVRRKISIWTLVHGHPYNTILLIMKQQLEDDTGYINSSFSLESLSESLVKTQHLSEYDTELTKTRGDIQ